jgi:dolichyl-phosphate-mannose-protein mannosyltransferase
MSSRTEASVAGPAPAAAPPWERWAVGLLLVLFVAIGANNIRHRAFVGQDFSFHVGCTNRLLAHPDQWFTQDFTNRPLIYWIALDGMMLTGDRAPFAVAAAVFVLLNAGALWLWYDCARRCVASPALRVAAVALIATLPVTLTTTVVFAADAMTAPPFALLCWGLMRWAEAKSARETIAYAAVTGAALAVGDFAKFTFIGLPVVVLGLMLLFWRWRRVTLRHCAGMTALGVIAPLLVGLWLNARAHRELASQPAWHGFNWRGTGEMTWTSLLGLRPTDGRIFAAPTYWDHEDRNGVRTLPMLEANGYSYPALLHLAIFTDVLDFGHGGNLYGAVPRPVRQQGLARWSVRTGVVFSLCGIVALAAVWLRIGRAIRQIPLAPATGLVVWSAMAMAWYLPIALALPFVQHAYDWGYWLPRLVEPALWGFGLALFVKLDAWLGHHPTLVAMVTGATAVQVGLQVASVWY